MANFQLDLVRCMWAVMPAAVLWGASFPLALSAAARGGDSANSSAAFMRPIRSARLSALGVQHVLVGWIGTQHSQQVLIVVAAASSMIVLLPLLLAATKRSRGCWTIGRSAAHGRSRTCGVVGVDRAAHFR